MTAFVPEILVGLAALAVFCLDLVRPDRDHGPFSLYALLAAFGILLGQLLANAPAAPLFSGMLQGDPLGTVLRLGILGSAAGAVALSLPFVKARPANSNEYYALMLLATLGALLVAGAGDLVMLFLSVELLSISSYVLVGWSKRDGRGSEAALKYLLFGAVSSAIFLYGASLLYGLTGATNLDSIAAGLAASHTDLGNPVLAMGALMALCGLLYKVSAVPFHAWTPDVYQGAPVPVTAYLSVTSKIAGFAALIRLLAVALPAARGEWVIVLSVVALVSMIFGNVVAIAQSNVKRMLAYSSIAQGGYVLLGLVAAADPQTAHQGLSAAVFYLLAYAFMNLGAFAVVVWHAEHQGSEDIESYANLARRHPGWTLALAVCLVSLAGLPPFVGFWGKFYLFTAVVQYAAATAHPIYIWLAVAGVLNSVVSMYYYLRIPKLMVMGREDRCEPAIALGPTGPALAWSAALGAVGCLVLFLAPGPLWQAIQAAINALS